MKKYLLLLNFCFPLLVFGQAFISPQLIEQANNRHNDPIHVLVTLRQQLNIDSLHNTWTLSTMPVEKRPEIILEELEKIRRTSQQEILQFLDEQQLEYELHRSLKIVNMLSMRITPNAILALSEHPDVRSIVVDKSDFALIEPVQQKAASRRSENGIEPGLEAIGARQMWNLGYTGRGRTAYSVDTGIWPNHPAIKNQWKGNRFPLDECWLPWDRLTPGDKSSSHGTHTSGTILGLDTSNNDTIGVAFNASLIASDPVVTDLSLVRPLSDYVFTYEWCLNPDGDISTTNDIPDAINNSWGRLPAEDAPYCDEDMTQLYQVLELAGVANLSSAGNEGPSPQTMTVPHNISIHEVNSFSVGSVNANIDGFPISDFSSRGPGMCGGDGSLLVKPEVVAPGQAVRSSIGQDEYGVYSGTSMACPHAVGAFLLLKEAFPYLPGVNLLQALYYSAADLGDEGEDNTYGNGMINVFAAYNYLIDEGYTPEPAHFSPYDLVITEVVSPVGTATCDNSFVPVLKVKNAGSELISAFQIHYGVIGEETSIFSFDSSITAGEEIEITLPEIATSITGDIEILFRAEMFEDVPELSSINNQIVSRIAIKSEVEIPFTETFEEPGFNGALWHQINEDNHVTWELYTTGGLPESQQSAKMDLYDYAPRASQADDLVGPKVLLPESGSLFVSFDLSYQNRNGPAIIADTLEVWIASTCDLTEPQLIYRKGGEDLSTFEVSTHDFEPDSSIHWRRETIEISDFIGEPGIFPFFRSINRKGNNLYIDNVAIYQEADPLLVSTEARSEVVIYPNPANDQVYIRLKSHETVFGVEIFDAMGRQVKPYEEFRSAEIAIDVSDLPQGMYFVKIGTDSPQVVRLVLQR